MRTEGGIIMAYHTHIVPTAHLYQDVTQSNIIEEFNAIPPTSHIVGINMRNLDLALRIEGSILTWHNHLIHMMGHRRHTYTSLHQGNVRMRGIRSIDIELRSQHSGLHIASLDDERMLGIVSHLEVSFALQ